VFVASAGGRGDAAAPSKVLRLNAQTLAVEAEIPLEKTGFGVVLDDAANRLYVGSGSTASVTVVDTASNQVVGVVQLIAEKVKMKGRDGKEVERYPHSFRELVLDKANNRIYMPGMGADSALYVVDTNTLKVVKVVPGLGATATGIALDDKAGKVYVSNLKGQFYTIDTRTLTVVSKVEAPADVLLNLAVDKANGRILATDRGVTMTEELKKQGYKPRAEGKRVAVMDTSGKLLASLPTGEGPVALLLDEQRNRLYVTNRGAGTVTVFDSRSNALLQTIQLPTHPNRLALDAKRNVLYVTVKNGKDDPKGSNESVARIQF
jgi:YVTN family beta-propeller protein